MSKKKKALLGMLIGTTAILTASGCWHWSVKNIPYTHRQNPLDLMDYIAGKNLFGRANSLQ